MTEKSFYPLVGAALFVVLAASLYTDATGYEILAPIFLPAAFIVALIVTFRLRKSQQKASDVVGSGNSRTAAGWSRKLLLAGAGLFGLALIFLFLFKTPIAANLIVAEALVGMSTLCAMLSMGLFIYVFFMWIRGRH